MPIKNALIGLAGAVAGVILLASVASGAAIYPTRAPTPTSYYYGDLDGDSAITTMDTNVLLNLLNGKAYTIGALQPDNPNQDWNTCDIDSDMACTTMDKNIYLNYLTGKEFDIDDKPWVISSPNLQATIYTVGIFIPFNANISSKNGTVGRAGVAVTATIHPIGDGFGSTTTGHISGRLCDPNTDGAPNQPTVLGVDDQCALAVTITDWHNFPALGLTESGQYGMAVEGDAPGTIAIELAIQDNGLGVPAITTTIYTYIWHNHAPTWQTAPSNIMIATGSLYSYNNGVATDVDTSQTLTCSSNGTTCGFSIYVGNFGPPPRTCNINFTAPATEQTCYLRMVVTDNGSPAASVGATISITILSHAPKWSTGPSNITITAGSTYNQINGVATDVDSGQLITCSNNPDISGSCGFAITVTGSGAPPRNCNLSFTAPVPAQTCNLRIAVTDNGSPPMSVGATISITIKSNPPSWQTAPSNITITGGSVYNQINGIATDIDTSQTLTCSHNPDISGLCGFAITVSGSGLPANCNVIFTAPVLPQTCNLRITATDNGSPAFSVGQTISITIVGNHTPAWQTAPSNIAIPVGSAYNQTNGVATDIDAGQTLTCSLVSTTCSFAVTVSGSGPNTEVDCNISFTAGDSPEYCGVTIQVSDDSWGNVTANINISIYPPVSAISAGYYHACALTTAGGVKCWGNNSNGQIGDNSTTNRWTPVDVVGLSSGVAAISAGGGDGGGGCGIGEQTCALTTAGGVKCWGSNNSGQLGDNTTSNRYTPVDVVGLTSGVAAISAGGNHTCALTTAGGVKCWGRNWYGQLGDNTQTDRWTPVYVYGLSSGVAAISAGNRHTCALTTEGGAKCWGWNGFGQIGDNTKTSRYTPVNVYGLSSGVAAIDSGEFYTCALTTEGGVKCWGYNAYGQLGDNTITNRLTPVNVVGLSSGVAAISEGGYHTCALTTAGGVKCWGSNDYGEIGDNMTDTRYIPDDVVGLTSGMAAISAGGYHTCALTTAGGVKCWGYNYDGEIGDNTITDRWTPVDVIWP